MSFLLSLDLFGVQKSWKFFGYDKYSTKLSSVFSIILIIILVIKLYNTIKNIFNRKSYTQNISFQYQDEAIVNISNLQFAVCRTEDWYTISEWDENFYIHFNYTKSNYSHLYSVDKKCSINNYNNQL